MCTWYPLVRAKPAVGSESAPHFNDVPVVFYCESPTPGPTHLWFPLTGSSVGSESAPHFNDVPVVLGSSSHGGERKRQRTCYNNTCEWRPQVGGTRGGALTKVNLFEMYH